MSADRRVAVIGQLYWDSVLSLDLIPEPGEIVEATSRQERPGGTAANVATLLARLGVPVTVTGRVGDDAPGRQVVERLAADGCDVSLLAVQPAIETGQRVILNVPNDGGQARTVITAPGPRLRRGDSLPLSSILAHDLILLDLDDPALRGFIADLPTHLAPRTRILGTLGPLTVLPRDDAITLALRHDYLIGTESDLRALTGRLTLDAALAEIRARMSGSQTRWIVVDLGGDGAMIAEPDADWPVPAFPAGTSDSSLAHDAFTAGIALAILDGRAAAEAGNVASALAALATAGTNATVRLPDRQALDRLRSSDPDGRAG